MSVCEQKNVAGSVYFCMCSQVLVFCRFRFWFFQRDVILISFFWSSLPLRINQVFDLKSPFASGTDFDIIGACKFTQENTTTSTRPAVLLFFF